MSTTQLAVDRATLVRAAIINDTIAEEHGNTQEAAEVIADDLGIELSGIGLVAATYANGKFPEDKPLEHDEAISSIAMAWALGALTALRAQRVRG